MIIGLAASMFTQSNLFVARVPSIRSTPSIPGRNRRFQQTRPPHSTACEVGSTALLLDKRSLPAAENLADVKISGTPSELSPNGSCTGSAMAYCTTQVDRLLTEREAWIFRFSENLPASSEAKPQSGLSDPGIEFPELLRVVRCLPPSAGLSVYTTAQRAGV